jgi:hypothetical protein
VTEQFMQYLEKTNNKIQDLLDQVRDADDISKVTEVYDEIATHADKAAAQLNKISDMLGGMEEEGQEMGQDENETPDEEPQKGTRQSNRGSREKAGSR